MIGDDMAKTCECCRDQDEGALMAFVRGFGWLLKLTGVLLVGAALFVAGRPMLPRARQRRLSSGATWLHGGARLSQRRAVHWYAWPGWERSAVRVALVALGVLEYLSPVATLLAAGSAVAATAAVALFARVRQRLVSQRAVAGCDTTATLPPVRVKVIDWVDR